MEIHIHKAHLLLEMLVVELTNSVSQVYYSIVVRKVFSFAHVKVSVTKMLDQVQAGFMTILILQEMSLLSYLYLTYNYYTSARQ